MAKKAKKAKLTTDEAMMAGHLPYELSMILSTLSVIGPWPPALLGIQNALLESCAIHQRIVIEFLKGENPNYPLTRFCRPGYTPSPHFVRRRHMTRINGHVAHLGRLRTDDQASKLSSKDLSQAAAGIFAEARRFTSHLRPEWAEVVRRSEYWNPVRSMLALPEVGLDGGQGHHQGHVRDTDQDT